MVEIDYDLIPLDAANTQQVARDARALAKRGKVPPIAPADYGRLAVVNPNHGFTLHHIPDELRKPLRRMMISVVEGSKHIPADQLIRRVLEGSDETLHGLLIELHSDFEHLQGFVHRLPEIRKTYPDCSFLLHGELPRVHALLSEILAKEGYACELGFHAFTETVTLHDEEDLGRVLVDLPKYPTFAVLFFDQVRIRLGGNHTETFTPATLRRLYRQFGVGNIDELDVSGKLKDRLITVDLPLNIIETLRFAPERGEAFHAVRVEEEKVYSLHFREKGLEGREIPMADIQALYRRLPGRKEEEFPMERVRALRVNCFEGHVSLLWKPSPTFIPLYEVTSLKIHRPPRSDASTAPGAPEAEGAPPIAFDPVVVTELGRPRFGDVRAGIRQVYLETVYRDMLSKQAKLKVYAAGLKIACLGPFAALTLKALKPFGLARVLPSEHAYYLCDTIHEMPDYHELERRLEERYDRLVGGLRELFAESEGALHPDLIIHRLPLVVEWARGDAPPYDQVQAEHLDSIYNELRVFIKFSESEFKRIDQSEIDHDAYFLKLFQCHEAALLAKQIASVKGGAYGRLFASDESPDFVFFTDEAEMERNREEYYLPGVAWCDIFRRASGEELSWDEDFAFSAYLEEQLSIIDSMWRQDYDRHPGTDYYERYFKDRIAEIESELDDLRRIGDPEEARTSPAYQEVYRRLEEGHRNEIDEYRQELDTASLQLAEAEERYFAALREVNEALNESELPQEALLGGDDYILAMDQLLAKRSLEILTELRAAIQRLIQQVNADLRERRNDLKSYLQSFRRMHLAHVPVLEARFRRQAIERIAAAAPSLIERLNDLQKASGEEARKAASNLHGRRLALKEELGRIEVEQLSLSSQIRQEVETVRQNLSRVLSSFSFPQRKETPDASPLQALSVIEERLLQARDELAGIIRRARDSERALTAAMVLLYTRKLDTSAELHVSDNEMALLEMRNDQSRLQRMMAKKVTEPLVPFEPSSEPGPEPKLEAEYQAGRDEWERLGDKLTELGLLDGFLQEAQGPVTEYQNLQKALTGFRRAVREKRNRQKSVEAISGRLGQLTREAEDLPTFIEERMLPSYRILSEMYLIPGAQERLGAAERARDFVRQLGKISLEVLQREFLDRAVFRRFQLAQFRAGAFYGQNPDHRLFAQLGNTLPAIYAFYRQARYNLIRGGIEESRISLHKLAMAGPEAILKFCKELRDEGPARRHTYLVLPGTMTLHQALDIIQGKDALFNGLPQLILIFISKFDDAQIVRDAALRERYFTAIKHNIIINLDSPGMVDNPGPIAARLVQETLGRAIDLDRVETAPEAETAQKSSEA